jgi:hypothetical protein
VEQLSGLVRGRMRRMVAFAAAPVLVTAVGASAWSPSAVAEAPVSVGADTVVSGVVTRDGVPVSEAEIVATAWPEQAVLDKLAAGDPVPTQVLGTVRSDKSGRFAVPVRPGTLGPDYTGPDGEADIAVTASDGDYEVSWNFTAVAAATSAATSTVSARRWGNPRLKDSVLAARTPSKASTHLLIDLGPEASVVEDGKDPSRWIGEHNEELGAARGKAASRVAREPVEAVSVLAEPGPHCVWTPTGKEDTGRKEEFVNTIGVLNARPVVAQKRGTAHTLGVGVKASKAGSSWTASGTLTRKFEASAETQYGISERATNKVITRNTATHASPTGTRSLSGTPPATTLSTPTESAFLGPTGPPRRTAPPTSAARTSRPRAPMSSSRPVST